MCGRGPRASLRVLRHGLAVTEMAVSELPGKPNAVWTVKAGDPRAMGRWGDGDGEMGVVGMVGMVGILKEKYLEFLELMMV